MVKESTMKTAKRKEIEECSSELRDKGKEYEKR